VDDRDRPVRVHVGFPSPSIAGLSMERWPDVARQCEALGVDTLWHSNERFYRQMWIRMTVSAMVTTRLRIGGAVVEPYAEHPALAAQALATLAELSHGRAEMALGAGGSGFPMMGVRRSRSAVAISEALRVIGPMLRGDSVTLEGEVVRAYGARLHMPPPTGTALWVATRGERTLEMAAGLADGLVLATYAVAEDVRRIVAVVERGASSAGRRAADLRLMSRVDTCVHDDPVVAREGCRAMVAKLLWASYPDRRFVEQAGLSVPPDLESVIATRDYDALERISGLVPDELIDRFCWAGTPTQVGARVRGVLDATPVREVGFWILAAPGQTLSEAVTRVMTEVVPRISSPPNSTTQGAT
jgi:5,10-methylenetetrahydromethanopterin reductase